MPCSFLTPLINRSASDRALRYVGATSEGEAVAIAAGAWLAGRQTAVLCQNSGLGNAVNPLTSLNAPFRIPTLLIVTWRGQPGLSDEPQHEVMGRITHRLLDTIEVPHRRFPTDAADLADAWAEATNTMQTGSAFAFIMEKGDLADEALDERALEPAPAGRRIDLRDGTTPPKRVEILERVLAAAPETTPIIATTGKTGRELFTLADRAQHFYQVGSMGCAGAMGMGVATTTGRRTIVLDGDGAALMKLGALATIGAYQPRGLIHVILDNGVHDSTGGQATVAPAIDFAALAIGCGYRTAILCNSAPGFASAFAEALSCTGAPGAGPVMIHSRIVPGSLKALGRPTIAPHEVAQRLRAFLAQGA